ncbi:MAG TPA: haloalkane dehalogenase [Pseudonocardia sp.]|nr:haloalkane dehalogenase [Pseudonocardia sp.]
MPVVDVLDSTISYLDRGSGTPVVFLHGNPTSSHVWRKVLARFGRPGRVLVPDLIGMGRSGKPDIGYSFDDHARYLDAWFDALGLDRVVLVGHDWGGALAFDRAARHPDRVLGIAFLEAVVAPMSWAEFPPAAHERFTALRTPGVGEELALDRNVFIEDALTRTMLTPLSAADHDVYRSHYPTRASRAPLLAWSRSMPIGGEPADVVARVEAYDRWLAASPEVPKLLLSFGDHPTLMIDPARVAWCREHIAGLEVVDCGAAAHNAPEDRPDEIAVALLTWAGRHGLLGAAGPGGPGEVYRLDRFAVPDAALAQFLDGVHRTHRDLAGLPGFRYDLLLEGTSEAGRTPVATVVAWADRAAYDAAVEVIGRSQRAAGASPQQTFDRLGVEAELGTYLPTARPA